MNQRKKLQSTVTEMQQKYWVIGAGILTVSSSFALYSIIQQLPPDTSTMFARPQVLFFLCTFLTLSAGTVPLAAYFNHRFSQADWAERDSARLLRQGFWIGASGVILLYMQVLRTLNWTIGLVTAGVFILIEMYFLTRE